MGDAAGTVMPCESSCPYPKDLSVGTPTIEEEKEEEEEERGTSFRRKRHPAPPQRMKRASHGREG